MKAGNKAKPQGEKKETIPAKKANANIKQNENWLIFARLEII